MFDQVKKKLLKTNQKKLEDITTKVRKLSPQTKNLS